MWDETSPGLTPAPEALTLSDGEVVEVWMIPAESESTLPSWEVPPQALKCFRRCFQFSPSLDIPAAQHEASPAAACLPQFPSLITLPARGWYGLHQ